MVVKSILRNVQQLYKKGGLFKKENVNKPSILVVAHRGASGYAPENTMAAFKKAFELKADFIELDVQMTKDNVLVVIHDSNVARTTNGTGEVREYSYKELKKLDAGLWFDKKFSGQRIPTLQEVLTEFHGKIGLLIEIKAPHLYPTIAECLASELKKNKLGCSEKDEVIVQSFDFKLLQTFNQLAPNIPLGLLVKYRAQGISNVQLKEWASLVQYINPNKALVTKRLVKRIHSYNLKVIPYTAKDRKSIQELMEANVDGVVTDNPDYIKGLSHLNRQ